ncbi:MAG: enolase C-terminal domain-like protein [Clostridia bacterium]
MRVTGFRVEDVRFPTSRSGAGSDAVNIDPDYSLAYVVLETDDPMGREGHGFTFTIGRGNEICVAAIRSLARIVVGQSLDDLTHDMAATQLRLTNESQMRWLGPEKGVIHLAAAAVLNALYDLWAKSLAKPLWKLLTDLSPREMAGLVDFRYLTDFLSRDEAEAMLERGFASRAARERDLMERGYPAYTTSVGWYGYPDDEIRRRVKVAVAEGWTHFKLKVGRDVEQDRRRVALVREAIGPERRLMVDANQIWEVPEAIERIRELSVHDLWWVEEPTSPDDVRGYAAIAAAVAPVKLAAGEHTQNRIVFKQLLQDRSIGFCQVDACRLAGPGEVLAVLLMAAQAGIPVCPHAGGVGLPEYVQHLAMVDYIAVSGSLENRALEYVEHLHEHFVHPVTVRAGHYQAPAAPGYSAELKHDSLERYRYPDGAEWRAGG